MSKYQIETKNGPRELVLASESRYRRELLDRLGLAYAARAHQVVEKIDPERPAVDEIVRLAREKAESLGAEVPEGLIIGSDQGLVVGRRVLGKPYTEAVARAQLMEMAGGTHDLVTAVALFDAPSGQLVHETEVSRLTVRALSEDEAAAYVALDQPLDCAGSFRIESLGVALFERIEGQDPTGIMGLPLIRLVRLLDHFGVSPLRRRGA